jgi:acyl-CoA synthetase (AMP-forming)/AMP-acid ligase II
MIFRSPYPDVQLPDAALTSFVLRHASRLADKPAIVDGLTGQGYTYGQLAAAVQAVGSALEKRGLHKGDVFAIYAPNSPDYAVAFHAVVSLGGIVTTVNPTATAEELARQLRDSGAAYLVADPSCLERVLAATEQAPVRELFVLGDCVVGTPFAALLADPDVPPAVAIQPARDLAALPYSSGTTGLCKGVMLTHANMVGNIAQFAGCEPVTERDTLIAVLPFFHMYGMNVIMNVGLATGTTIVTMPRFELVEFLQNLERYAVTYGFVAPPIALALAKQPIVMGYDLSRLRVIISGGAPLSADVANACRERIGCTVKQGYGLTETSPVTHLGPANPEQVVPGSGGVLIPNTEAMVVDLDSGAALGPDQQGELWIRGPQIMRGYLHRPEATAQMITPDGWLRTGDLGYADRDGNFFIVDRLKELIKYRAYQVAPAELEAVLLAYPAVADCAVIPSPDDEAGEVPKAFVVVRAPATPEELMAYVAERVAPYKKIRRLEFIDAIPKSASGKILRRVLVERERESIAVPVMA